MSAPISTSVINCLKHFSQLISSNTLVSFEDEIPPSLWKDELDRLRTWAANIGAHQNNHLSLDYRLRNASHIRDQVLRLLSRLERKFEELQDYSTVSHDSDLDSDSDSEEESQTYLQGIYSSLHEVVNCLFQLSVVIRQPAQHDRVTKIKRWDVQMWEPIDQKHIRDKYPEIHADLADRLGRAISHRRAVLRYNERHRQKLSHGLGEILDEDLDSSQTSSIPSNTNTLEYRDNPVVSIDSDSRSINTQTSYADSTFQSETKITVPPLPSESEGGTPYECPYCFYIISIFNHHSWARHVFRDIMAYSCVFPDCPTPYQLYATRGEWYEHLECQHLQELNDQARSDCLFCGMNFPSTKTLKRHIARHLQELALFALPPSHTDDKGNSTPLEQPSPTLADVESHSDSPDDESQQPASTSGILSSDHVSRLSIESTTGPGLSNIEDFSFPIFVINPVDRKETAAMLLVNTQSNQNLMSLRMSQILQLELKAMDAVIGQPWKSLPVPIIAIANGVMWRFPRGKTFISDFLIIDSGYYTVILGNEDIEKYGLVLPLPDTHSSDAPVSKGIRKGLRGIGGKLRKTFTRDKPSSQ
ncbi:hypothetical protein P168DRAFT_304997 [Aspergillus campestris IBT 28561]|uniref:C2H2-type domain-containing protein n=1 Tax=Aspergillus campestris (strain IBT 28561) TaxID=1392248 RepID=A0A2I1D199_ASPC2|nr:uncharacterized protein P168DRAFT_304997 [Aspergillus campestris IBT 28561]PKY03643.1 hypothetical protein P168DRAFT_304997 [Aspergillus campestris IBT 28561]